MGGQETAAKTVAIDSLLTLGETAQRLRISYRSVGRLLERGDLAFVEVGGRRLVENSELAAYVARNRRRRGQA